MVYLTEKKNLKTLFISSLMLAFSAWAGHPFGVDDAGVLDAGAHEVELSFNGGEEMLSGALNVGQGVSERFILGVGVEHLFAPEEEEGRASPTLSAKMSLIPERLAFSMGSQLFDGTTDLLIIATQEWGLFSAHINAGANWSVAEKNPQVLWGALINVSPLEPLTIGVEISGEESNAALLGGIQWGIIEPLQLSAGLGYDLDGQEFSWTAGTVISW